MMDDAYGIGFMITWAVTFVIAYGYCIVSYGFLLGVGLGWLPAAIVATLAAYLWPALAVLLVLAVLTAVAG